MTASLLLSVLFASALILSVLLKLFLSLRQSRAVATHRHALPLPFVGRIEPSAHEKAANYTLVKLRLGIFHMAFSAVVLLAWTLLGGLDALNGLLLRWVGQRAMLEPMALLIAFTLINAALDLPFGLYQTFVIEQRFGFNKLTWRLWLADSLKGAVVGAVIGLPLAWVVLWLMHRAGAGWWIWVWALWMVFSLSMMVLYPMVIAPLFNKFAPLEDPALTERVTALMKRCGFSPKGLFVMDGSRRSSHGNAYFTGFGAARRVVFFDTLLKQLEPAEVEAVLAHELGHFKLGHIKRRLAEVLGISFIGLALLAWLASNSWFYTGLGVAPNLPLSMGGSVPNDALALILFMLVVPVFTFFFSPVAAAISRRHEFEADAFAAKHAKAADLVKALVKLHEDNASTLTPDPVYVRFYYSHPPALERIAQLGEPVT